MLGKNKYICRNGAASCRKRSDHHTNTTGGVL